jgi:hypothetical protein
MNPHCRAGRFSMAFAGHRASGPKKGDNDFVSIADQHDNFTVRSDLLNPQFTWSNH